jgi:hypothetical protein
MATPAAKRLTDEQLAEALALASASDSVELKFTVPDSHRRLAVTALDMDPLDSQVRLVYFFDTPDLALDRAGLVVRARRVQGRGDDSVVKLRPVIPGDLPASVRNSENVVVELDALPAGFVCSASMKRAMGPDAVTATIGRGKPLRKLFSKEQRAFFKAHAPDGVTFDDLRTLGPILVLKLRKIAPISGRKLVAELWHYPDNQLILELSTKTVPGQAVQVAGESRAFLSTHGVDMSGEQRTKTKTALEFFAGEIAARETAAAVS